VAAELDATIWLRPQPLIRIHGRSHAGRDPDPDSVSGTISGARAQRSCRAPVPVAKPGGERVAAKLDATMRLRPQPLFRIHGRSHAAHPR